MPNDTNPITNPIAIGSNKSSQWYIFPLPLFVFDSFILVPSNGSDCVSDNHLVPPCFSNGRFVFAVLCDCFFKCDFTSRYNVLANVVLRELFCFSTDYSIRRILFWC